MHLLSPEEPVFVVDLSDQTMLNCRRDFTVGDTSDDVPPANGTGSTADGDLTLSSALSPTRELATAEQDIRAVALVFDWDADPVLLAVNPTRDIEMLDALARLLRAVLLTGHSVAHLATEYGDAKMRRLYFAKRLPRFVYRGIPLPVRSRLPKRLVSAMGSRR